MRGLAGGRVRPAPLPSTPPRPLPSAGPGPVASDPVPGLSHSPSISVEPNLFVGGGKGEGQPYQVQVKSGCAHCRGFLLGSKVRVYLCACRGQQCSVHRGRRQLPRPGNGPIRGKKRAFFFETQLTVKFCKDNIPPFPSIFIQSQCFRSRPSGPHILRLPMSKKWSACALREMVLWSWSFIQPPP